MFKKSKVILLLGIIVLSFYGCSSDRKIYIREIVKSELSPNGKYQALVLVDGGGDATVDFSKHVVILSKDQKLSKGDKLKRSQGIFKGYHIRDVVIADNNKAFLELAK